MGCGDADVRAPEGALRNDGRVLLKRRKTGLQGDDQDLAFAASRVSYGVLALALVASLVFVLL